MKEELKRQISDAASAEFNKKQHYEMLLALNISDRTNEELRKLFINLALAKAEWLDAKHSLDRLMPTPGQEIRSQNERMNDFANSMQNQSNVAAQGFANNKIY